MKKISVIFLVVGTVLVFSYCSSGKNVTMAVPKVTYQANITALLQANCTPCHFPDKGGRKKPLNTYASASGQIIEILRRIQLNPTDRGFMPDKHAKLSDSTIAVFKQWQTDGLLEK